MTHFFLKRKEIVLVWKKVWVNLLPILHECWWKCLLTLHGLRWGIFYIKESLWLFCQWTDQPFQHSLLVINVTFKAFLINSLFPNKNYILLFYLRLKSYMIYYTSVIYVGACNQHIMWFAVSVSELLCFSVLWGRLFVLWLAYLISASNCTI